MLAVLGPSCIPANVHQAPNRNLLDGEGQCRFMGHSSGSLLASLDLTSLTHLL